jgi:hypothetical protein
LENARELDHDVSMAGMHRNSDKNNPGWDSLSHRERRSERVQKMQMGETNLLLPAHKIPEHKSRLTRFVQKHFDPHEEWAKDDAAIKQHLRDRFTLAAREAKNDIKATTGRGIQTVKNNVLDIHRSFKKCFGQLCQREEDVPEIVKMAQRQRQALRKVNGF